MKISSVRLSSGKDPDWLEDRSLVFLILMALLGLWVIFGFAACILPLEAQRETFFLWAFDGITPTGNSVCEKFWSLHCLSSGCSESGLLWWQQEAHSMLSRC